MPASQTLEGEIIEPDPSLDTSIFVFKTKYEPNVGKITYFKVKSGEVNPVTN